MVGFNQISLIEHPVSLNTFVKGRRKSCACKNAKWIDFDGEVRKVIKNQTGIWYYLSTNVTVRASEVEEIRG